MTTAGSTICAESSISGAIEFEVLYYTRKNKIHKSKGVSKKDGTLVVNPPPSSNVVLRDMKQSDSPKGSTEGGKVLFRGIQRDLSKRIVPPNALNPFDVVVLGSYEIEILCNLTTTSSQISSSWG